MQIMALVQSDKMEHPRTHLFIGKPDTEENRKAFVSTIPMGRPSTPEDIANACCYLASDEANFITGVDLEVRIPERKGNRT